MKPDVVILESDASVDEATKMMKEKNSRSVLVSKRGEVIGIVSKTDILFKVISQNGNPSKVKLREIMTCPILAVGPSSTIKEALSVMDKHGIRQVMVHAYAAVLGVVNREDIYQSMETLSMTSEDTAISGTPACIINTKSIAYMKDLSKFSIVCPYCQSPFDTKEGLSKHIDRLHGESGILEGDVRRLFE
jgi:signal-transduction protein with cAMP-binding, CBS, and nucleotidyltransferase domain